MDRYFILSYGNRQWMAYEGQQLRVDYLSPTQDQVELDCIYDSKEGFANKKMKFNVVNSKYLHKKIIIVKYRRRHNSRKKQGFRQKSTIIKIGV